jgi:release factor glutamine methyltransferase
MTVRELVADGIAQLEAAGISEARANAEYLAAHILNYSDRSDLRAAYASAVSPEEAKAFGQLIERRKKREPLQYILGEWEFYGLPIFVTPDVLIPRPETEILVEETLRESGQFADPPTILDIGTGSGAIPLALSSHLPSSMIYAMDTSAAALKVAKRNAERLGVRQVQWFEADLFDNSWIPKLAGKIDLLVSNPPYVSTSEFENLEPELRMFEPREALTDNASGLTFYERIAEIAPTLLSRNGRVLVELGFGQAEQVRAIMERQHIRIERVVRDLANIERVLVGRRG